MAVRDVLVAAAVAAVVFTAVPVAVALAQDTDPVVPIGDTGINVCATTSLTVDALVVEVGADVATEAGIRAALADDVALLALRDQCTTPPTTTPPTTTPPTTTTVPQPTTPPGSTTAQVPDLLNDDGFGQVRRIPRGGVDTGA
jgi:type II secretory pathway pseudopilin PulG